MCSVIEVVLTRNWIFLRFKFQIFSAVFLMLCSRMISVVKKMFFVLAREIKLRIFVQFSELNQLLLLEVNKIHSLNQVMGFARKRFVAL